MGTLEIVGTGRRSVSGRIESVCNGMMKIRPFSVVKGFSRVENVIKNFVVNFSSFTTKSTFDSNESVQKQEISFTEKQVKKKINQAPKKCSLKFTSN